MNPKRTVSPLNARARPSEAAHGRGPGAGGPVGAMQAELNARLTAAEYERWLLPPEPRSEMERFVHLLSLGAGVLALTAGAGLVWLLV